MNAAAEKPAAAPSPGTPPGTVKHTGKKAPPKSARRRSRELAMQGLYEWLVSGSDGVQIEDHIREMDGFDKCDRLHFDALLHNGIEQAAALDAVLARHADRKTTLLSPVEHAVLMIGVYEFMNCVEIPYRVAINEAVELAKTFGGTDGHRYVNGVLDKCAGELRAIEVQNAPRRAGARRDTAGAAAPLQGPQPVQQETPPPGTPNAEP